MNHELLEALYWEFDARRNGYAEWRSAPQSERDAFKSVMVHFAAVTARSELQAALAELNRPLLPPWLRAAWPFRFTGFWARVRGWQ